jgi:hypothetical protein
MAAILFFYNKDSGSIATGNLSQDGNFTGLTTGKVSTGWSQVTTVGNDLLFFYNKDSGSVATGNLSQDGNFTGLTTGKVSTGWSQVITVD